MFKYLLISYHFQMNYSLKMGLFSQNVIKLIRTFREAEVSVNQLVQRPPGSL